MECPNCPNDETFFRRDGLENSHLCGICGASILIQNQQETDENVLIGQNLTPSDFQNNDFGYDETLIQDNEYERSGLATCFPVKDSLSRTLTQSSCKQFGETQSENEHLARNFGSDDPHAQRSIDNSELANSNHNYKLLQKKHVALWDDFRGLEMTLEELMVAYEAQIEVTQKLQSDHRASDELREMEINRLRTSFREEQSRAETLEVERAELSSVCCQLKSDLASVKAENERRQAECLEVEEKFNHLKQQAERKLKLAEEKVKVTISSYTSLQESYSLLENEVSSLSTKYTLCSAELKQKDSQCAELSGNVESLLDVVKEKDQEISNSATTITNAQHELQIAKQKLHDMQEMNCRFKAGLVRANEDNRSLKEKLARLEFLEKENLDQLSRLDLLMTENSKLKSRIFDAMETEKALRRELSSSNYVQIGDYSILEELEFLRKDLQEKTIENKELLQISKELLDNLECTTLKLSHSNTKAERDL